MCWDRALVLWKKNLPGRGLTKVEKHCTSALVKKEWRYIFTPAIHLRGVDWGELTLYLYVERNSWFIVLKMAIRVVWRLKRCSKYGKSDEKNYTDRLRLLARGRIILKRIWKEIRRKMWNGITWLRTETCVGLFWTQYSDNSGNEWPANEFFG